MVQNLLKKSNGEQLSEGGVGNLSYKINQLKRQIQAERVVLIKEKIENNRKKLESDVSRLVLVTLRKNASLPDHNDVLKMFCLRTGSPICKYGGFTQGSGEKDYINCHEVVLSTNAKLPYVEKIPPYTTWMFLDRNQRMAEDQSVVGRRRIYYDQHGSEALICSDSEDDLAEPEEEKHEFTEGEDRILWMVFQEHGLSEEVVNIVGQLIGVSASEIEERCSTLKEKYDEDHSGKDYGDSGSERNMCMDKSLNAALDSFDNLFCRRCLVFDCRLHGCSQTLINPSEKLPYWSEYEDDRKPCSDHCCLQPRVVKDLPESSATSVLHRMKSATLEKAEKSVVALDEEPVFSHGSVDLIQNERCSEKKMLVTTEVDCNLELDAGAMNLGTTAMLMHNNENTKKRKAVNDSDTTPIDLPVPDNLDTFYSKKHKNNFATSMVTGTLEGFPSTSAKTVTDKDELQKTTKDGPNDVIEQKPKKIFISCY
uniref:Histone-lysine N-methyltransferase CLF-like HTH domain-containing protein n=2 Tax=Rhizophora mucronata TaxID=61149 RepID=A0A2P2LS85_RHIMU